MRPIVMLVVVVSSALPFCGCGSLGWYRSIGNIPGVAPSDWAFYAFCGTSSQVFQFSIPQVQSAAIEALTTWDSRTSVPPSPAPTRPSP